MCLFNIGANSEKKYMETNCLKFIFTTKKNQTSVSVDRINQFMNSDELEDYVSHDPSEGTLLYSIHLLFTSD